MRAHPIHHEAARRAEVRFWSAVALGVVGGASALGAMVALAILAWRLL